MTTDERERADGRLHQRLTQARADLSRARQIAHETGVFLRTLGIALIQQPDKIVLPGDLACMAGGEDLYLLDRELPTLNDVVGRVLEIRALLENVSACQAATHERAQG